MDTNVFFKQLKMEFTRALCSFRSLALILLFAFLLPMGDLSYFCDVLQMPEVFSVWRIINYNMIMDTFKVLIVIILCCIHTRSFCDDYSSHYIRSILCRVDINTYAQCKALSVLIVDIIAGLTGFWCAVGWLRCLVPLMPSDKSEITTGNADFIFSHPYLYLFLLGLEFSLITSACGSIGLLFSSIKPNGFVTIALSGLAFFILLSYTAKGTAFDVYSVMLLDPVITHGKNSSLPDIMWALLYPLSVVWICGIGFRKCLHRRLNYGNI